MVLQTLKERPAGISEYELFSVLREAGEGLFDRAVFKDKLTMFQAHFVLFHVLYLVRDALLVAQQADLLIDCTCIMLRPYAPLPEAPLPLLRDPLRTYYEELDNLAKTTREDVEEMLAGFWRAFSRRNQRAKALATLGLEDPVSNPAIKRRYRALAMEHHPDRGGDEQQLKQINAAMAILKVG